MKIEVTAEEAKSILNDHFSDRGFHGATVTIAPPGAVSAQGQSLQTIKLAEFVDAARDAARWAYGSRKIAAIKAVREVANKAGFFIGLAEAKNFVESIGIN